MKGPMKVPKKKAIETLKREEFNRVYNKGLFFANKHLVIYILKRKKDNSNVYGISVSKKVGKAVVRNRIRRLIKESLRLIQHDIKMGHSIIIVARNPEKKNFKEMDITLKKLLKKANMLL